ncbi:hypothetical protein ABBQ32_002986 [Trebouxia sp. C0010 RCD-2024]
MVCPCRVVLAGLSAFIAVFLIWHTTRDGSQKSSNATDEEPGVRKVRCCKTYRCRVDHLQLALSSTTCRVRKRLEHQACSILGEAILCWTCSLASFCGTRIDNGKKLSLSAEQHLQLAPVACTAMGAQPPERGLRQYVYKGW